MGNLRDDVVKFAQDVLRLKDEAADLRKRMEAVTTHLPDLNYITKAVAYMENTLLESPLYMDARIILKQLGVNPEGPNTAAHHVEGDMKPLQSASKPEDFPA